jgi:Beta/Gamma crystallin
MKQALLATALLLVSVAAFAADPGVQAPATPAIAASLPGRITSVPVRADAWVQTQGRYDERDRGRGRGIGAVLYSNPDFRGDRYTVQGDYMRDLANTGFNDRAQSLAVERGYWIFCSDADFQGTCRTFGPGEYRRLPRGLDNRISSGRRISENYPYQGRPNWERR